MSSTPLSKQSVVVAQMMLETGKTKCQQAVDSLDRIRKKQNYLDKTTHMLLEKALPKEIPGNKRNSESEEKSDKKVKTKPLGKNEVVIT